LEADTALALGFDFGRRRIGVAVGSRATGGATPLACIPARDGVPDWEAIRELVEEWRPSRLVVGLPYNIDGTESEMTRSARRFGNRMGNRFGLPVEFVDERLSSSEAERRLRGQRRSGERRRRVRPSDVDAMAAAIILESWLGS
jgi:putative Holliday junction resolvase